MTEPAPPWPQNDAAPAVTGAGVRIANVSLQSTRRLQDWKLPALQCFDGDTRDSAGGAR